jgi:hypothetical protein
MNTCDKCFHSIENDLGHWCLRYHVYVFPKHGMGRNCSAFVGKEDHDGKALRPVRPPPAEGV